MNRAKGRVRLKLEEYLIENEMTQKDFAEKSGLSENAITTLKRSTQINYETLAMLVEATELSLSELLEYIPENSNGI